LDILIGEVREYFIEFESQFKIPGRHTTYFFYISTIM